MSYAINAQCRFVGYREGVLSKFIIIRRNKNCFLTYSMFFVLVYYKIVQEIEYKIMDWVSIGSLGETISNHSLSQIIPSNFETEYINV